MTLINIISIKSKKAQEYLALGKPILSLTTTYQNKVAYIFGEIYLNDKEKLQKVLDSYSIDVSIIGVGPYYCVIVPEKLPELIQKIWATHGINATLAQVYSYLRNEIA